MKNTNPTSRAQTDVLQGLRKGDMVPPVLDTQHRCGKATISGQEAAILVQSVSAALRGNVSQWHSDETGVPLKWLTDRWCQQRWWVERRGEPGKKACGPFWLWMFVNGCVFFLSVNSFTVLTLFWRGGDKKKCLFCKIY